MADKQTVEQANEIPTEEDRIRAAEERYRRMMQGVNQSTEGSAEGPSTELVALPELESFELRAVRLYHKNGSLSRTATELGVSTYELGKLAGTQEWQEELIAIRRSEQAALDARYTSILGTTLTHLEDRLANGEKTINDHGEVVIKPISAMVLVKIAELVFDKRQIVRELPTNYNGESNKLAELAAKLEEFGTAQRMRTIDMDEGDAKKA